MGRKCFLVSLCLASAFASTCDAIPYGLFGGSAPNIYAAQLTQDGVATPLSLQPDPGGIVSVSINQFGQGLIGGQYSGTDTAFAALVSAQSVITAVQNFSSPGIVASVSINSVGAGLIGGYSVSPMFKGFAALVSPEGNATMVSGLPEQGIIFSVSLNSSNYGLIGGVSISFLAGTPYVAIVSPYGVATTLSPVPVSGTIQSVAINDSGFGLVGGQDASGASSYAAQIFPSGVVSPLSIIGFNGTISSVAINSSGSGILGGLSTFGGQAYAGLVSPDGVVTNLANLPLDGDIFSVDINSSGNGIVGGVDYSGTQPPFAALVSSSGVVTPLIGLPSSGTIRSVAINSAGNGLIVGDTTVGFQTTYAMLVSSTGSLIPIPNSELPGFFYSAALMDVLSFIPTMGLTGNSLALANYINQYSTDTAFYFVPAFFDETLPTALVSAAPTAHGFDIFTIDNNLFFLNNSLTQHIEDTRHNRRFQKQSCECSHYQLWGDLFGATALQKSEHQAPSFQPRAGGVLLGFDSNINNSLTVGVGAAYAHTYLKKNHHFGDSHLSQEYLFGDVSWNRDRFYLNGAIWGGLFQIDTRRRIDMTAFHFKASSHPKGWQLAPHFEAGYHTSYKYAAFEPFGVIDWINNRQYHYKERGAGPLNFGQKDHTSSFLRSEIGLRIYQTIQFDSWRLVIQEKGAYAIRKLFGVGEVEAYILGSPGSFITKTLTSHQNVVVGACKFLFESNNPCHPNGSVSYQGEFGKSYQSHQLSLNIGWSF